MLSRKWLLYRGASVLRNLNLSRSWSSKLTPPVEFITFPDRENNTPVSDQSHPQSLEINWNEEMKQIMYEEELASPMDPVENPSKFDVVPVIPPTFNLSGYANKSKTIQELIKLGADLHKIERRKGLTQFVVNLDYERDMKEHLDFLTQEVGVSPDALAHFLTKNPLIFKEDLADLETRVNYMLSKRFSAANVAHIVEKNPYWLMFATQRIDRRLGFFQNEFQLNGNEVRAVTIRKPQLITYRLDEVKQVTFSIREEFGLDNTLVKALLLSEPKIWMKS